MEVQALAFSGTLPPRFQEALAEIGPLLGFIGGEAGIPVEVVRADGPVVEKKGSQIRLGWKKPVQLYRALSLLRGAWNEIDYCRAEIPCFETGIMFDASRNAVPRLGTLQCFLRRMALMGMNVGMLYTEDTYEVPGEPYIGYMRGRYSMEELRKLDDYAAIFGIELIPCIQTLGHLNRILHWPVYHSYADNGEVLLADNEDTYGLLRRMIQAASAPFRSKRIHIGMDEAHGIGLGRHLQIYGYENPHDIIRRHLLRVKTITDELGLKAMMWSDMYFRPDSPTNGYYDSEPSEDAIQSVVPDVQLVYWDYYHNTEAEYTHMLEKHKKLTPEPLFAGAIWTFAGPAPDYEKTLQTTVSALSACKKAGVSFVLATAWGDNGAEANLITALPGMQLYAEFAYTGCYAEPWLTQRFRICCNGNLAAFLSLSKFNQVPGMRSTALRPVNAAKFLLYQDPMVQLFAKDTQGLAMARHYSALAEEYGAYAAENGEYTSLMDFYVRLARTLAGKCRWHEEIASAILADDKSRAATLADSLEYTAREADNLRVAWRGLWMSTNRPYGFEILDGRIGAVIARLDTARTRVQAWALGDINETLPELRESPLPYTLREEGTLFGSYAIGEIVSACKIDI